MRRRIMALAHVETLRLLRSRTTFTLLILVPAMQVLLFGYAIRPTQGRIGVAIAAPTAAGATRVAKGISRMPGVAMIGDPLKPGGAAKAVKDGKALIGIEVPPMRSFANPMQARVPLRIVVDATSAGLTSAAVAEIESAYWRGLAEQTDAGESGPGLRIERLYNPDARADWTFLPALIGVTVMIAMIMLGAISLARERESGTWEALQSLPVSPVEMLLGKLLPYVVIGTAQGVLVLIVGCELFALPTRGSVVALVVLLPLFAAANLALGYAISMRAKTQVAALQGAVAFYLPSMLLSGFLYPFETLPDWARWIGNLFPLTHFIRAARGALLHGDGAAAVLADGGPMLAFLITASAVALLARSRSIV